MSFRHFTGGICVVLALSVPGGPTAADPAKYTHAKAAEPPAAEQFVGSSPCDALPRHFLGIPGDRQCERITWSLGLDDAGDGSRPGTYELEVIYGMQIQGAPGFVNGGTRVRVHGTWSVVHGTRVHPTAVVYRIRAEGPTRSADFARIGRSLLHLLDEDGALAVGNAGWSYTLNLDGPMPAGNPSPRSDTSPLAHATTPGVFEGRTPCRDVGRELNVPTSSACTKMKWRLTLFQDRGAPSQYKLETTGYRNPPRTGKWAAVRLPGSNAIVYQLDPGERGAFLSLFKADDNILFFLDKAGTFMVGDSEFSFTLNRRGP